LEEDKKSIAFIVDKVNAGKRIDKYLSERIKEKSRSYIQKLIDNNLVKVNGINIAKNYSVSVNDKIEIDNLNFLTLSSQIKPQKLDLKILYENSYYLVLSKQAGIVTHPAPGNVDNTLVNAILYYLKNNPVKFGDKIRIGIVHRLDKDTSGLIIVAKNDEIQRKLSEQFKSRLVKKNYVALVWGRFSERSGEIRLPIGRSRVDRKKMKVSIDRGREAITNFDVIEEFENCTLLNVRPKTGRTHQIRVHFSYIDHPIIGDKKYGNKNTEKLAQSIKLKRQFLHAKKLEFLDPVTNEEIKIEDKLTGDLEESLKLLRSKIIQTSNLSIYELG
jgi:23S rRNA pseudouridine1911/1915/1917 synthase